LAWRRDLTEAEAMKAAGIVATHLDWSEQDAIDQVADYMRFQSRMFRKPTIEQ